MVRVIRKSLVINAFLGLATLQVAVAQTGNRDISETRYEKIPDDPGTDGLKHHGAGSIDDDEPSAERGHLDDVSIDGWNRRGDGSIDDDQPASDWYYSDDHQRHGGRRDHNDRSRDLERGSEREHGRGRSGSNSGHGNSHGRG